MITRNTLSTTGLPRKVRRALKAAARDESGVSAILVAGTMVFMLSVGTMAVDAGMMMMRDRKLQNAADIATIAATHDMARATDIINQSIQANGYSLDVIEAIETGTYDPTQAPANRFTPGVGNNAIRLSLRETVPLYFMKAVSDQETVSVSARAIASNIDEAAFSATTGLVSLEDGVLNALLTEALGTSVSLTLINYQGLLNTDVDALTFFDALATNIGVSAGTYNDLLLATATTGDIIDAMVSVLQAEPALDGQGTTALAALESLQAEGSVLDALTFQISELFDFGTLGLREIGEGGKVTDITAGMVTFDLLFQSLYAAKMGEIMDLGVALNVPGVIDLDVQVAVGEPLIGAPSNPEARIVVGPVGSKIHTSPMRISMNVELLSLVSMPGIGLQSLRLPLYIELARGDAEVTGISCGANPGNDSLLTLLGSSGAADVYIGDVDPGTPISNFSQPVTVNPATLLWIPLVVRLRSSSYVSVDGTAPTAVSFTGPEMAIPTTKRIGDPLSLSSALTVLDATQTITVDRGLLAATAGLLGITNAALIAPVHGALDTILPDLDDMLAVLSRALGLEVGYMDLTGYGVRCGAPALVG